MNSHINNFEEKYQKIGEKISYVTKLKSNQYRLEFVKKHGLSDSQKSPEKFQEFIAKSVKKNKMKVVNLSETEENVEVNLYKNIYEMEIVAWHDEHIFAFINDLYEFSPGFVQINELNISRISNINTKSHAIKMELLCCIYYVK
ncbi:MAG: hypothetical protein LBI26_02285 [Holosporales bacterium]|jgi:hypothetical protein|nr:hypothetical protein [Holosporales bacterium]